MKMKKKILIGSIFAALILLSMPFMSTIQAREAKPVVTTTQGVIESMSSVSVESNVPSPDDLVSLIRDGVALSLQHSNSDPAVVAICSEITATTSSITMMPGQVFCSLLALAIMTLFLAAFLWMFTVADPFKLANLFEQIADLIAIYEENCGEWPPWGSSSSMSSEMNINTIETYVNNIEMYVSNIETDMTGGCSLCGSSSSQPLSSQSSSR